jgi:hypothetical protein
MEYNMIAKLAPCSVEHGASLVFNAAGVSTYHADIAVFNRYWIKD